MLPHRTHDRRLDVERPPQTLLLWQEEPGTPSTGAAHAPYLDAASDARTGAAAKLALTKARAAQRETLRRLVLVAAAKDGGTPEHCLRVGALSALLAEALQQPQTWCDMLFDAAPLHDLGKATLPEALLNKSGPLLPHEWAQVRTHPVVGAYVLGDSDNPVQQLAAEIALNHHEKWDGSGYPAHRSAHQIPLSGRIVAVADFFDSVTNASCYRDAMDDDAAFRLLDTARGAQFDPTVVDAMHRIRHRLAGVRDQAQIHAATLSTTGRWQYWWRRA